MIRQLHPDNAQPVYGLGFSRFTLMSDMPYSLQLSQSLCENIYATSTALTHGRFEKMACALAT